MEDGELALWISELERGAGIDGLIELADVKEGRDPLADIPVPPAQVTPEGNDRLEGINDIPDSDGFFTVDSLAFASCSADERAAGSSLGLTSTIADAKVNAGSPHEEPVQLDDDDDDNVDEGDTLGVRIPVPDVGARLDRIPADTDRLHRIDALEDIEGRLAVDSLSCASCSAEERAAGSSLGLISTMAEAKVNMGIAHDEPVQLDVEETVVVMGLPPQLASVVYDSVLHFEADWSKTIL